MNTSEYPLSITKGGVEYRLDTLAYNVATRDSVHRMASMRGSSSEVSGRNGSLYTPSKRRSDNTAVLEIWAQECDEDGNLYADAKTSYEGWKRNINKLLWLFDTSNEQVILTEYLNGYGQAGAIRARCEVTAAIEPSYLGRHYSSMKVELRINDVFWESVDEFTISSGYGTSAVGVLSLSDLAGSNAPIEDALYKVSGPITNPQIIDRRTGHSIQYNGAVASGSRWLVDAKNFQSSVGSGDSWTAAASENATALTSSFGPHSPRLMAISPAGPSAPEVELRGSGAASNTRLQIKARKKFH